MGVNNLTYSGTGLRMTESFEGDVLTAYQDQNHVWTIGYGHTAGVYPGQTITQEQADTFLAQDIQVAADCINEVVQVALTQNQFDALVDFAYNIGTSAFRSSTLLRDLNAGQVLQAVGQFDVWDYCNKVVNPGLLRRRNAEAAEFNGNLSAGTEIA